MQGVELPIIFLPDPLAGRPEEEIITVADAAYEELRLILVEKDSGA
jgi:hypothetical protein